MTATNKLDDLLNQLKDQKWHSLPLLSTKLTIPLPQLQKIAQTLHQKNIIRYNPKTRWIKLKSQYIILLTETTNEEKPPSPHKPILATLIIPPKQNITIQNLHLTNTTQQTLEIHVRTCEKKTQIAINKLH